MNLVFNEKEKKEFYEFMEGFCFTPNVFQRAMIDYIFCEEKNDIRVKSIFSNNETGKTVLEHFLYFYLESKGLNVLYCGDDISRDGVSFFPVEMINNMNRTKYELIYLKLVNLEYKYDLIIVDGYGGMTLKFNQVIKLRNEIAHGIDDNPEILTHGLSGSERSWLSAKRLYRIIEDNSKTNILLFTTTGINEIFENDLLISATVNKCYQVDTQISDNNLFNTNTREEINIINQELKKHYEKTLGKGNFNIKEKGILEKDISNQELMEFIEKNFNKTISKIEDVHSELTIIHNKVDSIISTSNFIAEKTIGLTNSINNIETLMGESDDFVSEKTSEYIEEIKDQLIGIQKNMQYNCFKELLENKLGEDNWNKLSHESQLYLTSAKLTFASCLSLQDNYDFSGVCLLVSKALELELSKRFVTQYVDYLKYSCFQVRDYPEALKRTSRSGNIYVIKEKDYSLGSTIYIFGLDSKKNPKNIDRFTFEKYCSKVLFKSCDEKYIRFRIAEIANIIENIRVKYRNPAAHKGSVSFKNASNCLDYIIEVEQVLKGILDDFNT